MDVKICREEAENELERILTAYQVEPEGVEWERSKETILKTIMRGNLLFDDNTLEITMTLLRPIKQDNGDLIKDMVMREPTAGDLSIMDKYKKNEEMKKSIALASKLTGKPEGIIDRMVARDLMAISAIVSIFF